MLIRNIAPFTFFAKYLEQAHTSPPQCPTDTPLSCHNDTVVPNTCCFEYPGGVFLQTQFWDYKPSRNGLSRDELEKQLGPLDDFTIHGLWPDNCNGGYEQFCDYSLEIDDVHSLLSSDQFNNDNSDLQISGKELLGELEKLWKSNNGNDESLWIHEYNKHGTCIKTIKPDCYQRWSPGIENKVDLKKQSVYDYFRVAYNLYKKLNTSEILEQHGIVPSKTKKYTRKEIEKALSEGFEGKAVFFACDRYNALNEIWYYHALKGSLLGEEFVGIDSIYHGNSRCPEDGIKFFPKGYIPDNRKQPSSYGIIRLGGETGELIGNGHWMINKTPAHFFLIESEFGNYHLRSRAGYCGFNDDNALSCQKSYMQAAQFEYENGYIGYSGTFNWGSDSYPNHGSQSIVYYDPDVEEKYSFKLKFIKK